MRLCTGKIPSGSSWLLPDVAEGAETCRDGEIKILI